MIKKPQHYLDPNLTFCSKSHAKSKYKGKIGVVKIRHRNDLYYEHKNDSAFVQVQHRV